MATNLISFPFRVGPNGSVVTLEDGDPEYYSEEIAMLALTRPTERELVPTYGIADPTFSNFPATELGAKIQVFGPPVKIVRSESTYPQDGVEKISVSFVPLVEIDSSASSDVLARQALDRQVLGNTRL